MPAEQPVPARWPPGGWPPIRSRPCRRAGVGRTTAGAAPDLRHRQPGRRVPDRVCRPAEHSAHQSRPRRPPSGDQHHALRVSIYNPGDVAPAHVHSPNASRTILSDHGGYTNIEGERCEAKRGDLILTPNGTWHDHGNDSKTPVIWIDMLDWPLMEYLDIAWVDLEYEGAGTRATPRSSEPSTPTAIRAALRRRRIDACLRLAPARLGPQPHADDPLPWIGRARGACKALRSEAGRSPTRASKLAVQSIR